MRNLTATLCLTITLFLGSGVNSDSAEFAVAINDMGLGELVSINDMGLGELWYLEGACAGATPSRTISINDMGLGKLVSINHMGLGKAFCITNPEYIKNLNENLRRILLGR
jgi:hypothetical protein